MFIKLSQMRYFELEVSLLRQDKDVPRSSNLISVKPFLDDHGLLRIGDRLEEAVLTYDQKHPLVLHKDCELSILLTEVRLEISQTFEISFHVVNASKSKVCKLIDKEY